MSSRVEWRKLMKKNQENLPNLNNREKKEKRERKKGREGRRKEEESEGEREEEEGGREEKSYLRDLQVNNKRSKIWIIRVQKVQGESQWSWKNIQRIDSLKLLKVGKNYEPTN